MDNFMRYLVEICQHNGDTDKWNYKQTLFFESLDEAKKAYHNQLGTYIGYGALDHVSVILWDSYGNKLMSEYWHKVTPEPEPNTEG